MSDPELRESEAGAREAARPGTQSRDVDTRTTPADLRRGGRLSLHSEVGGEGPPLLLLHGFTGSARSWDAHVARLQREYTTICVDLPGHGRTEAPADVYAYTMDATVQSMCDALDAATTPVASVLGYSMGGRVSLRLALDRPERVSALILESCSPGLDDPDERRARMQSDEQLALSIEQDGLQRFVDRWERLPLWSSQASLSPDVRAELRRQRLTNRPIGLANSLRGLGVGGQPALHNRIAELKAPVQFIAGGLDRKYVSAAQWMASAAPDSELAIVEDAGHAVHLERPERFDALTSAFLASISARARRRR